MKSLKQRGCKALCCSNCRRLSVSSTEEAESSSASDRFPSVSSVAHAMVQERLDQLIRERRMEERQRRRQQQQQQIRVRERVRERTKFVVMVAMEKCSYDPREDFRESMMEMITANRIKEAKDLRSLLNYYISMNSNEYHGLILELFHELLLNAVSAPRRESEMSQLGMMLQESLRPETEARTILGLLTDQMDAVVHTGQRRRRTLKDRFRFTGMGCCGATWVFRPSPLTLATPAAQQQDPGQDPNQDGPECERPSTGMNLAAALAAERELRGSQEEGERDVGGSETPWRMSLMRLLEETEGGGGRGGGGDSEEGGDRVCCVCMGRKKGAAFIPCGHTFCRVCCREVWLNRGTCPLCNRSILEILDIF